jgi:CBS domain-containing protein
MSPSQRVSDFMTTDVVTVRPDLPIMRLVHLIVENGVQGAVVTNESGELAGIVTERDCINVAAHAGYFDELGGTVAEFMSAHVETFAATESLMNAVERMGRSRHRLFPVIGEGRVIGLLSRRDVLRALVRGSWFTRRAVE